jgi:Ca-activated chloride channel homolog
MLRAAALGLLTLVVTALPVAAAGLSVTIQQVDVSNFPRVRVAVSVAEGLGVPITGLDAQAFEVKEDDQVISPIRVDSIVESQEPVATALVMDVSGSMGDNGKIDSARTAATAFLDTLGPRDSAAVISFSNEVKVVQGYTSDRAALKSAIASLQPGGDTSLYDAINQTAQLQGALPQRRKVLLVLSDGADTRSKTPVDATIAATQQAGVVVFAIGLGEDVNRDILDQLAGLTGQAIYVSDPAQLRETFLAVGDRLRRQYVLEYTSKARPDDKQHAISVKAVYRGQDAEIKGNFTAPKVPLLLDVRGLTNAGRVSGVQRIDVAVGSGEARQVELFVDDQSRGLSTAPPFTFQWDTVAEKPGIHKVILRGTDAGGVVTDKEFVLEVVGAAPTPAVSVTIAAAQPAATPVAARTVRTVWEDNIGLAVAGLAALVLVLGTGAVFLIARTATPKRRVAAPVVHEPNDKTEFIVKGGVPLSDVTMLGTRRPVVAAPKAKLVTGPGQDVPVAVKGDTMIGRDASGAVVLDDPQASRRHARIFYQDDAYWIEDLNSTNGTRVNGETITKQQLQANDQISVGDAVLTFVFEST